LFTPFPISNAAVAAAVQQQQQLGRGRIDVQLVRGPVVSLLLCGPSLPNRGHSHLFLPPHQLPPPFAFFFSSSLSPLRRSSGSPSAAAAAEIPRLLETGSQTAKQPSNIHPYGLWWQWNDWAIYLATAFPSPHFGCFFAVFASSASAGIGSPAVVHQFPFHSPNVMPLQKFNPPKIQSPHLFYFIYLFSTLHFYQVQTFFHRLISSFFSEFEQLLLVVRMEMAPPAEATSNSSAVAETKEETSATEEQINSNLFEGQQQRVDGELGQRAKDNKLFWEFGEPLAAKGRLL
jgi:hypothetical protein